MSNLKCADCGQIFNDRLSECPNCGCPVDVNTEHISDSEQVEGNSTQSQQRMEYQQSVNQTSYDDGFVTTDTGVENERIIKTYAKVIWIVAVVFAALAEVGIIVQAIALISQYSQATAYAIVSVIGGTIVLGLLLLAIYVLRAFIMVVHNMSINIHEINMKIK